MREIKFEKFGSLHAAMTIEAGDPGPGGASVFYRLRFNDPHGGGYVHTIEFQNGNPAQQITGISNEAIVAVLIDRMHGFQNGPGKCRENAIALTHFEVGLLWLQKRTREREARGVEGTPTP